jgi:hypothetical protein
LTCLQTPHCTALHVRGSGLSYSYLGRRLLAQASRARTVQCRHADDARARAGGRAAHVDRPGLVSSWPVAATGDLRLASARGQLFDPRDPGRGRRDGPALRGILYYRAKARATAARGRPHRASEGRACARTPGGRGRRRRRRRAPR